MGKELIPDFGDVDSRTLDVATIIGKILPRGHVIHGYSSANSTRMLMVLKSKKYSDTAPLLGFGTDGAAELALCRALLTYAMREQQGLDSIKESQFDESRTGSFAPGLHNSRFDNIVWGGDFWLYQEGDTVKAGSNYGGGNGLQRLEVEAPDALGAITLLTDTYQFFSPNVRNLPAISLDYVPYS